MLIKYHTDGILKLFINHELDRCFKIIEIKIIDINHFKIMNQLVIRNVYAKLVPGSEAHAEAMTEETLNNKPEKVGELAYWYWKNNSRQGESDVEMEKMFREYAVFLLSAGDENVYAKLCIESNKVKYFSFISVENHYLNLLTSFISFIIKFHKVIPEINLAEMINNFPYNKVDQDIKKEFIDQFTNEILNGNMARKEIEGHEKSIKNMNEDMDFWKTIQSEYDRRIASFQRQINELNDTLREITEASKWIKLILQKYDGN